MSVIVATACCECNIKIPFYSPEKFVHRNKAYHIACFRKKHEPLQISKMVMEFVEKTIEEKGELPELSM